MQAGTCNLHLRQLQDGLEENSRGSIPSPPGHKQAPKIQVHF